MQTRWEWLQRGAVGRFLRFCMTGGLNTIVDFGVYTALTAYFGWDLYLSQVLSYSAGMLNSYCINRSWTFQTKEKFFGPELVRFIVVNLLVMLLSLVVMRFCNEQLHWYYLFSKLCTVGFTMVLGFLLNRLLVFRSNESK